MKILLVGQNLQTGGVQMALVNLLKTLSNRKDYDLDVFLFGDGDLLKEVSSSVQVIQGSKALRLVATPFREVLKRNKKIDIFLRILLMIMVRLMGSTRFYNWLFKNQKELGNYDIAISYFNDVPHSYFNQGTNQYVLDYVNSPIKLAWVHNDPIEAGFEKRKCQKLYKEFDVIVCVSNAVADKLREFLPEFSSKIKTVYNIFPIEEIQEKAKEIDENEKSSSILKFVTVTRIDNDQKKLKRICEVCQMLQKKGITNYRWTIVGDGPDLETNRKEINRAGLADRVNYIGSRTNPYPYIAVSDLFILTSNYEGFPMVIQEALILGVPVLTTPYAAVREQVKDGVNGLIAEMNSESIFDHLKVVFEDPMLLKLLKDNIQVEPVSNSTAVNQLSIVLES